MGGLRVLRLCSVFEPAADQVARAAFDPIGGMQNHTASLTRALDRLGVHQTVITSRLGGAAHRRSFGDRATVARVGLPITRFRQFWAPAALWPAWRDGPYDVVHVHQGEDVAVLPLGLLLARRFRCPLVVTLHTSVAISVPRAGLRLTALATIGGPLERRLLRRADRAIALTETTARQLPDRSTVAVIPSGAEPGLFADLEPAALLADVPRPRVLYVGRLARQKDVATLVRAFGLLRTPAALVIVGDGPERAAVDQAVAALPPERRACVYRHGFRPHPEVPGLLAGADVLALPSVYEEMGSVLVEALQAGVPVVASRVGGIPDVVVDGETGLLVPPGDPVALATALDDLLADPARRDAMRAACRRRCAAYSWDDLAQQVLAVYEQAVAARRCSSPSVPATRSMV